MHVYVITNTVNGKLYVGQHTTDNLHRYLRNDITRATLKNGDRKPKLYPAIRKYGGAVFTIRSLVRTYCKERLDMFERFYIKTLKTQVREHGYNIAEGGGGSYGYKREFTPDQRRKLSIAGTGRKHSDETKRKMSAIMKGRRFSEEHKQNISLSKMGRKVGSFSEEHKQKIANANRGHAVSAETREKLRQASLDFQKRKRMGLLNAA